ncbi:LysE/ArgO family amino acid transporter [Ectobacillus ponti]|uniref:LysE/ArgO family amino acid transporter n=1 Tax=Ectobacillus ponti TaxID=2961894 RepID=A0AA41X898_9BACI|nr:LysE/ArgO family amino acid transporter [Ectobacillus ponti]MCP8970716.1 LysE/ArgO family amino acid transporter [Ectobacillus ponti]
MFAAIAHGFVLAFGLILPLGAQNVFVFHQGAGQPRFRRALPVIITAGLCDTCLILLAVLGVSVLILTLQWLKLLLFTIGLFFLLYMGWSVWRSAPASLSGKQEPLGPRKQIAFAMSVSLLNPHAILDTVGVIGTSSLAYTGGEKALFTLACICVSWLWFFGLALGGRVLGARDTTGKWIVLLNKLSACIIWGVAVYIALQLLREF